MSKAPLYLVLLLLALAACGPKNEPKETSKGTYEITPERKKKIDKLLKEMSLAEKVGQMTQLTFNKFSSKQSEKDGYVYLDTAALDSVIKNYHIGSWLGGFAFEANTWANIYDTLQRITLRNQPHQIPMLFGIDHVHGSNYISNGTVFPHNISLGNSFNTTLASDMGEVTAKECHGLGHLWVFAPVLDLGQKKYWPRNYETFGEDPLLAGEMGVAYTVGLQDAPLPSKVKVAACAKHFLGYSHSTNGWDRSPIEMSDQTLQEFYRPSHQRTFDEGIKTVMINSGEINGEPVHASYKILTELLRDDMGFQGVAVTDWEDINSLYTGHKVAASEKEAVYLAISAGVDMSMVPYDANFCTHLIELVEEGRISMKRIDQSVRRILELKFDLGLFENPYATRTGLDKIGSEENYQKALQAARESIVLMKNKSETLPLAPEKTKKLVVCGPAANTKRSLSGGWTLRWQANKAHYEDDFPEMATTVLGSLEKIYGEEKVSLAKAGQLRQQAAGADAIVCVVGEPEPYSEGFGSIIDLDLPMEQQKLVQEALATGKPVVLVLVEGRPRTIPNLYDTVSACLFAGWPGYGGGQAIAEIIAGKVNPSARMCFSYPYKQGHILPYNYKPSGFSYLHTLKDERARWSLLPFGGGESYTKFTFSDLKLTDTVLTKTGSLMASVTVKNEGKREGKWPVLFFLNDHYASITRPVKELKYFTKVSLKPGEEKAVSFEIKPMEHLSFPDATGRRLLENGSFSLMVEDMELRFWLKEKQKEAKPDA